ncbi:MAG: YraN family protein [Candidatus Saccharimonadales bacterium]
MAIRITSLQAGQRAEQAASQYLVRQGYQIVARNWRTRWCEIDLIARQDNRLTFVEVKYRSLGRQGQGLDYITPAKIKRMRRGAQMWVHRYGWAGDYGLGAIGLFGADYTVDEFVADII